MSHLNSSMQDLITVLSSSSGDMDRPEEQQGVDHRPGGQRQLWRTSPAGPVRTLFFDSTRIRRFIRFEKISFRPGLR